MEDWERATSLKVFHDVSKRQFNQQILRILMEWMSATSKPESTRKAIKNTRSKVNSRYGLAKSYGELIYELWGSRTVECR